MTLTNHNNTTILEIAAGVYRVDVCHPSVGHTCCYLIVQDNHAVLIDCGAKKGIATITAALKKTGAVLDWLIVTHAHLDHAGAAGQIMQLFPEAQLACHPDAIKHLANPDDRLVPAVKKLYSDVVFNEEYHPCLAIDETRLHSLADGVLVNWRRALRVIHTPGHAWHHLSIHDETADMFYAGDAYGVSFVKDDNGVPFILPVMPLPQFAPEEMEKSINTLRALNCQRVALAHYGVIEDSDSLAQQQKTALHAWLQIADDIAAAGLGDFLDEFQRRVKNWVSDMATKRGMDGDSVAKIHAKDIWLDASGFKHLVKDRLAD